MKPHIGISEKNLEKITEILSQVLANQMILYVKTRKFHWNVSGESFMELHLLFEGQYEELEEAIDEVAERINKLGSNTIGTMQEFISMGTLKESPSNYPSSKEMLKELLADHEAAIHQIRIGVDKCSKLEDAGTTDFLTKLLEGHETIAWKLRRYLK